MNAVRQKGQAVSDMSSFVCCLVMQDVQAARQDATENVRFLEPLRKLLEKLNTMDDFVALADHFKPLLHSMLLIWKLSSSYSSSARFATLLREICNDLIMQVCYAHSVAPPTLSTGSLHARSWALVLW
jgi:hypothetical protein